MNAMTVDQSYTDNALRIDVAESGMAITLSFHGKSIQPDPGSFMMPILLKTLEEAITRGKRIVMDFCSLQYMNSSTLTPVIRILERARLGRGEITVTWRRNVKWQDISFSALTLFGTPDGRIVIEGAPPA